MNDRRLVRDRSAEACDECDEWNSTALLRSARPRSAERPPDGRHITAIVDERRRVALSPEIEEATR